MTQAGDRHLAEALWARLAALPAGERERRLQVLKQTRPELAQRLQQYLAGAQAQSQSEASKADRPRGGRPGRRVWLIVLPILVVLVVAVIAGGYALREFRQLQRAVDEAEQTQAVESFLSDLFRVASPYMHVDGRDPLAIVGDLGSRLLDQRTELEPRSQARLQLALARLQRARGDSSAAQDLLRSAQAVLATAAPAPTLSAQLQFELAGTLADTGAMDEAVTAQRAGLTALEQLPALPEGIALAQIRLAEFLHRLGRFEESQRWYAQSIPVLHAAEVLLDPVALQSLAHYLRHLGETGERVELRSLRDRMLQFQTESSGLAAAELQSVLGQADLALGDIAGAAARFEAAAAGLEAVLGAGHPRLALALSEACGARLHLGETAVAERLCQQALTIYYAARGPDSVELANASARLARIGYRSGRLDEAHGHADRARRVFEQREQLSGQIEVRKLMAQIHLAQGRHDHALSHIVRADQIRAHHQPENRGLRLELGALHASCLAASGQVDAAATMLAELTSLMATPQSQESVGVRADLDAVHAQIAARQGDTAALEQALARAQIALGAQAPAHPSEYGLLLYDLGVSAALGGAREQAQELLLLAAATLSAADHGAHWASAWAAARATGVDADRERDAAARDLLQRHRVATPAAQALLR